MFIKMTKTEVIAALEEKKKWAKAKDAEILKEHRAAEKAFLQDFKVACRAAAKWDYETAKKHNFNPRAIMADDRRAPYCPVLYLPRVENYLTVMDRTNQRTFTLSSSGSSAWWSLYDLLTADEMVNDRAC